MKYIVIFMSLERIEMSKYLIIADIHSNNNKGICTGHYIPLARMFYVVFNKIVHTRIASGPIYQKSFDGDKLLNLPYDMIAGANFLKNRIKAMVNSCVLFKKAKGDTIILQDGRPVTNHIGIALFYHGKSKLYLIKYTTNGLNSLSGRLLWKIIKSRVDGIICPNEEVGKAFGRPYCVVPDYIYTGEDKKCPIDYKSKTYDLCVVGRLNKDKGVVETAKRLNGTRYKVLIAGQANDSYTEELKLACQGCDNIDLRLGYVSDEDYTRYINESRYCILNYQGEYSNRSSGVVFDIIFSGVPVVGNSCKALQFVEDYNIGHIYDNVESLSFENLFDVDKYETYLENINKYRQLHKEYYKKLSAFIGIKNESL